MKRAALALLCSLAMMIAPATSPARATVTASTSFDIPAAAATPVFHCTDVGCGPLISYTYLGPARARPAAWVTPPAPSM